MLDDIIMLFGVMFIIMIFVMGGAMVVGYVVHWSVIQDQAQFIAESEGRYGGYTTDADSNMRQFIAENNINPSEIQVQVSAPGSPVPWGTPVWAKITDTFHFTVGNIINLTFPVTGDGRSVSSYLNGAYVGISYTNP